MSDTGLTPFLLNMMRTPVDRLLRADAAKLAAKYQVRADWVAFYIRDWVARQ